MQTLKSFLLKFRAWSVIWKSSFVLAILIFFPAAWFTQEGGWLIACVAGLLTGFGSWVILVLLGLCLVEPVQSLTMAVGEDLEIKHVFQRGPIVWKWDPVLRSGKFLSFSSENKHLSARLDPLTPNPKVRHLVYHLRFVYRGTPERAQQFYRKFGLQPYVHANKFLWSLLYVFSNSYSNALGELFDPTNEDQQAKFQEVILSFLNPQLKDTGIYVADARFDDALNPFFVS